MTANAQRTNEVKTYHRSFQDFTGRLSPKFDAVARQNSISASRLIPGGTSWQKGVSRPIRYRGGENPCTEEAGVRESYPS